MTAVMASPIEAPPVDNMLLSYIAFQEQSRDPKIRELISPDTISRHLGEACLFAYLGETSNAESHIDRAEEMMGKLAPHLPSVKRKRLSLLESYIDLAAEDISFSENLALRHNVLIDLIEEEMSGLQNPSLKVNERSDLFGAMNEHTAIAVLTRLSLPITAIPALVHHDQGRVCAGNYDFLAVSGSNRVVKPVQVKSAPTKQKYNAKIKCIDGVKSPFGHRMSYSSHQTAAKLLVKEASGDATEEDTDRLNHLSTALTSRIFG